METNISILLFVVRIFLRLFKWILPKKITELSGVWCCCWRHGKNPYSYETGSIEVYQLGKIVVGSIYHKDTKWPFKGIWDGSLMACQYCDGDGDVGEFSLGKTMNGSHENQFKGSFTGRIESKEQHGSKLQHDLRIVMSRGDATVCEKCGHIDISTEETCLPFT